MRDDGDRKSRTLILACEGLRSEMDWLAQTHPESPSIIYVEQGLHNQPDKMRADLNRMIRDIEAENPELQTLILGYGLCGKGLCGVTSSRVQMVIPRVHDCVPLYVGVSQDKLGMTEENSGFLWLSTGMLEYSNFSRHLVYDRHVLYREKFGEKRAGRMIQAENKVFANYRGVRYVRWPATKEEFAELAKATARELSLPFDEINGNTSFLCDLMCGNYDEERFLILEPGETICMNTDGQIVGIRLQDAE